MPVALCSTQRKSWGWQGNIITMFNRLLSVLLLLVVLALASCNDNGLPEGEVRLDNGSLVFAEYDVPGHPVSIKQDGPYIKFDGSYPERWPDGLELDERFYLKGGTISSREAESESAAVVYMKAEGAFAGTNDEFQHWLASRLEERGQTVEFHQRDPAGYGAYQRMHAVVNADNWQQQGFTGQASYSYGPRYAGYVSYSLEFERRLGPPPERADSGDACPSCGETHDHSGHGHAH